MRRENTNAEKEMVKQMSEKKCDLVVEIGRHRYNRPISIHEHDCWYREAQRVYRELAELQERNKRCVDITDDEIEFVHAWRELKAAQADGIIRSFNVRAPQTYAARWSCGVLVERGSMTTPVASGGSDNSVLAEAAAIVHGMRRDREAQAAAEAEEQAIAAAEARIMAVYHAGYIACPDFPQQASDDHWRYYIRAMTGYKTPQGCVHVAQVRETQLAAATAAAEWCESLVEKKPRLPVLSDMDDTEKVMELVKRGYEIRGTGAGNLPCLYKGSKAIMVFTRKPYTLTDVLEWARSIDDGAQ